MAKSRDTEARLCRVLAGLERRGYDVRSEGSISDEGHVRVTVIAYRDYDSWMFTLDGDRVTVLREWAR